MPKTFYKKGGIIIPNTDFITSLLNIDASDLKTFYTSVEGDTVFYHVTLIRKPIHCPMCDSLMIGHGQKLRKINHPAFRNAKGTILYNANRYICKQCKKTAIEVCPFSFEGFNSSYLVLQNVMKYLSKLNYTLQMISTELNVSTTQICKYLDSYITIPNRPIPECLGIDELYDKNLSRRNSSYICVLVDNVNRTIYDVLDSRNKNHLALYFSKIPRKERLNVKYITIDMWEPYKDIAQTYFPNAAIAVDPFHVISHLTKGFDRLRIDLMNQCEYNSNAYYLLKNWHDLLNKPAYFLDNERVYNRRFNRKLNRRDLFCMICDTFPILHTAYDLKEAYRCFNIECSYEEACIRFDHLIELFKNSGIPQFNEFTFILINWHDEILNSFMRPYNNRKLSNSFTENINGQIRSYLNISNGITNFQRFRKRVIYSLSTDVFYSLSSNLKTDKRTGNPRGSYNKTYD